MKLSFPEAEVTRSLYSNLYKAGWVVVNDDARIIDTNKLVEKKLHEAAKAGNYHAQESEEEGTEGFNEGISAEAVDALLDPDGEGAILKSASAEELERIRQELEEAKAELSSVQDEAQHLLENAQAEIEAMKMRTLKEAEEQGYQEGYRQGMDEVKALREECLAKEKQLEAEYTQRVRELEPEFVDNLTRIYEHIFKVDLSEYHQLVVTLLTDAMQKADVSGNIIVHVAREDYGTVSEAKEEILEKTGMLAERLDIIPDMTLAPSQCMIETEGGIYDCSLGTELKELTKKLMLLSYRGGE
ncbi:MAG: FliH/SctL family protein [Lachnospiraceae bacterium]|nr:FliH/SctL family protein [Lachnospiraceae bacterium]